MNNDNKTIVRPTLQCLPVPRSNSIQNRVSDNDNQPILANSRGRPLRVPDRGDVTVRVVAVRLGLSVAEFESVLAALMGRGFPEPDETTGRYCMEAVDRWRLRRHSKLFPELTTIAAAVQAEAVFEERIRRLHG